MSLVLYFSGRRFKDGGCRSPDRVASVVDADQALAAVAGALDVDVVEGGRCSWFPKSLVNKTDCAACENSPRIGVMEIIEMACKLLHSNHRSSVRWHATIQEKQRCVWPFIWQLRGHYR